MKLGRVGITAAVALAVVVIPPVSVSNAANQQSAKRNCTIKVDGLFTYGTSGRDVICGNSRFNVIYGRGGNDVILGGDDRDLLYGGTGLDRLKGGLGDDQLTGEFGHDLMVGRRGDDTLYDQDGVDRFLGGPGQECFFTIDHRRAQRNESDRLFGGSGTDKAKTDDADVRRKIERTPKQGCVISAVQQ